MSSSEAQPTPNATEALSGATPAPSPTVATQAALVSAPEPLAAVPVNPMGQFFTRERANEGKTVFLADPTTGEDTEHWIMIRGADSDIFRNRETELKREAFKKSEKGSIDDRIVAFDKIKNKLIAALVIDWSFDHECNEASVLEFFNEAPQIADALDTISGDRTAFFSLNGKS